MSNALDQDKCIKCGEFLPCVDQRPAGTPKPACPKCGSMGRIKNASMHMVASVNIAADAQLIIGWQEVDRLLAKEEFAAALLVAAVNVEFILWENLLRFTPSPSSLDKADNNVRSDWGQVRSSNSQSVSLGSLLRLGPVNTNGALRRSARSG